MRFNPFSRKAPAEPETTAAPTPVATPTPVAAPTSVAAAATAPEEAIPVPQDTATQGNTAADAAAPRPRTGNTFPADEVVWGIAVRNGFDELDDPYYHRGITQHAYLEGNDSVSLCGFRPPRSGPRLRRRARLGLPTAGDHPMCGICARMVVAPARKVTVPVVPAAPPVAVPVARPDGRPVPIPLPVQPAPVPAGPYAIPVAPVAPIPVAPSAPANRRSPASAAPTPRAAGTPSGS